MEMIENNSGRSWFDRPEGKFGAVAGAFILVVLVIATLNFWGPAIAFALESAVNLAILLGGVGLVLALVLNPGSRNFFILIYKMIFKTLTSMVIQLDPMMILKDYVKQLYDNLNDMSEQIQKVRGVIQGLKTKIAQYTKDGDKEMNKARLAKEKGKMNVATVAHRKAQRRKKSVQKLTALRNKIEMILRVLVKMHENCGIMAEDTADEVELKQDEWESIKAANGAMRSAMSMISGGGDKRANYEQALEFIVDDISLKMGEMEDFMYKTETLMDSIDLENDAFDEKMIEELDAWEKKSDSWILGDDKEGLIKDAYDESKDIDKEKLNLREVRQNLFG